MRRHVRRNPPRSLLPADRLQDFVGEFWLVVPLIGQIEYRVDDRHRFGIAEGVFLDHVVFPKPSSDFAPIPQGRTFADRARRRRKTSRASDSRDVLIDELPRSSNPAGNIGLAHQVRRIDPEHIRADLGFSHIADCRQNGILQRSSNTRERQIDSPRTDAERGIVTAGLEQSILNLFGHAGDTCQNQGEVVFGFTHL